MIRAEKTKVPISVTLETKKNPLALSWPDLSKTTSVTTLQSPAKSQLTLKNQALNISEKAAPKALIANQTVGKIDLIKSKTPKLF